MYLTPKMVRNFSKMVRNFSEQGTIEKIIVCWLNYKFQ